MMEIIVMKFLLWYPQDAPWYLAININFSSTAFSAAFLLFRPFLSSLSPFLTAEFVFPGSSVGRGSSAVRCLSTALGLCVSVCTGHWWLRISEGAQREPRGSIACCVSVGRPACLWAQRDSLRNVDPVQITQLGPTRTLFPISFHQS